MNGKELRARREALGLSQEALARKVGISARTIHRWETGKLKTGSNPVIQRAVSQTLARLEAGRREES